VNKATSGGAKGASRDGGVAARRRGAPRGTGGRGEALATSKGRRGGAGTLRRRLGRGVLLLARGTGDTGLPGSRRVTLTTGR